MSEPKQKPEQTTLRPLTKSRFKVATECPTKLYYYGKSEYANKKEDDPFLKALARGGFQVGALAQVEYGPGQEVTDRDYQTAWEKTRALLLNAPATVFEGGILYENHFVKADILKNTGEEIELIEVKAKSWAEGYEEKILRKDGFFASSGFEEYLYDIAYQTWVARNAFKGKFIRPYLLLVNKEAVATVNQLNQKFKLVKDGKSFRVRGVEKIERSSLGQSVLVKVDVRDWVNMILENRDSNPPPPERGGRTFDEWVQWLADQYERNQKITPVVTEACRGCEYRVKSEEYPGKKNGFSECWKDVGLNAAETRARSFDVWGGVRNVITPKPPSKSKKKKTPDEPHVPRYFLDELDPHDVLAKDPSPYEETNPLGGWSRDDRRVLQVEHARVPKVGPQVHQDLKAALKLPTPWHFIDFETAGVAVPFAKGQRPYETVAFQFSHHVMYDDGRVEHKTEFLKVEPGVIPNFEFVRALKRALEGDNGTVFRYAAHENSILNSIHDQLLNSDVADRDELVKWIRSLATPTGKNAVKYPDWRPTREFVDLLKYVHWFFWHPQMGGSNSIKVVLPAILASSAALRAEFGGGNPYDQLGPIFSDSGANRDALDDNYGEGDDGELRDGGAAMLAFCRLQFTDLTAQQRAEIEAALLRYCKLDTLAMVILWKGFLELAHAAGKK